MFTNRSFSLIVVAVLVVVVALAAQQAFATKAIVPETGGVYTESKEQALREFQLGERYGEVPPVVTAFNAEQIHRDYFLGERYGVTPQKYIQPASDFYQRHPDWTWTVNDQNASIPMTGASAFPDYYQRHPELSVQVLGQTASDYFMRHPELTAPAEESVDRTDYFFRHPEFRAATTKIVDLTDYFFRHR